MTQENGPGSRKPKLTERQRRSIEKIQAEKMDNARTW